MHLQAPSPKLQVRRCTRRKLYGSQLNSLAASAVSIARNPASSLHQSLLFATVYNGTSVRLGRAAARCRSDRWDSRSLAANWRTSPPSEFGHPGLG
jgi:hypothetical protein